MGGDSTRVITHFTLERTQTIMNIPFQAGGNIPMMPPMPPIPNDIVKIIKEHVDSRLDEIMSSKDNKFHHDFKRYVASMLHEDKEDESWECCELMKEKAGLGHLYCTIFDFQKKSNEGKSMMEIESDFFKEIEDITPEEKRVFSSLLRSEGPHILSNIIGFSFDDYLKHMKELGSKIHHAHKKKHHHEHHDKHEGH